MRKLLTERLGSDMYSSRIGVHALRSELQPHVDARWGELLGAASQAVDAQLAGLQRQLQAPPDVASETLDDFVHRFCLAVHQLVRGSIALAPALHGETLLQEVSNSASGPLCKVSRPTDTLRRAAVDAAADVAARRDEGGAKDGEAALLASAAASAQRGDEPELDHAALWLHAGKRLYGGAQYWRAMHEFMLGAAQGSDDEVSIEDIVNAMGVDGYHDGVNYMRAVCVLVIEKARGYFDSALVKLRLRMLYIMSRLSGLADELMLTQAAQANAAAAHAADKESGGYSPAVVAAARLGLSSPPARHFGLFDDLRPASASEHARFMGVIAPVFQRFVSRTMAATMDQCAADVGAMTRYVSWDFNSPTRNALQSLLIEPVHQALEARFAAAAAAREEAIKGRRGRRRGRGGDGGEGMGGGGVGSLDEMVAGITETLLTRRVTNPIRVLMTELVSEVIRAWREEFCRTISLKLHAGFLLPLCETLPNYMRKEVNKHARDVGLDGGGAGDGKGGGGAQNVSAGLDARTSRLQESIEERLQEKQALERIAERVSARHEPD